MNYVIIVSIFPVIEQIRITVCQAQLLVRSKMKQYLGLVEKAEVNSLHLTISISVLCDYYMV